MNDGELKKEIEHDMFRVKNIRWHDNGVTYEKDYKASYRDAVGWLAAACMLILFILGLLFGGFFAICVLS